ILFSQGNNTYYAGLDSTGDLAPLASSNVAGSYTANAKGNGSNAMAYLLNGNYFTPQYLINPAETNHSIHPASPGVIDLNNYSYAVSEIADAIGDRGRRMEWKDNTNTQAAVVSDRTFNNGAEATGQVSPNDQRSIWSNSNGDWRGSLVFGDNSTTF